MHQARNARKPPALNLESVAEGLASAFCCCKERWYSRAVHDRGMIMKKFCFTYEHRPLTVSEEIERLPAMRTCRILEVNRTRARPSCHPAEEKMDRDRRSAVLAKNPWMHIS